MAKGLALSAVLLVSTALAGGPALAGKPKLTLPKEASPKKQSLPKILKDLEARYQKEKTISAKFSQDTETALTGQKKTSTGTLLVSRPGKIRWETEAPQGDRSLLISDGKKVWFYTPPFDEGESGQLIERSSQESKSKLETALLSGSFSLARDMRFEKISETEFSFIPRKGTAGTVSKASVKIDPKALVIQKVTIEHLGGNKAEITLSDVSLGKPVADSSFEFKAPPNTDRVNE